MFRCSILSSLRPSNLVRSAVTRRIRPIGNTLIAPTLTCRPLHQTSTSAASAPLPPPNTPESAAPAPSDSSRLASNSRTASIAFARWLSASGVRFNSLNDNRPLFGLKRLPSNPNDWFISSASRVITKGETIFRLPVGLTLAPSNKIPDPLVQQILQHIYADLPTELWQLKNGVRLMYEYSLMVSPPLSMKTSDSFFSPYINLLPASYPTIPIFWNAAQITAIQYQPIETQVKLRSSVIRGLSDKLKPLTQVFGSLANEVVTPERIGWAMSSVSSRAFKIRPTEYANLPLIDMMNHSFQPTCKVTWNDSSRELEVIALNDIQPGTELTLNYGWHNNDSFLLNYGFIIDENPADNLQIAKNSEALALALEVAGEASTPLEAWQKELMEKIIPSNASNLGAGVSSNVSALQSSQFLLTCDAIDPYLIAYAKIMTAPPTTPIADRTIDAFMTDTGSLGRVSTSDDISTSSVSGSNEWIPGSQSLSSISPPAARLIFSYLSLLQSGFPTSLQDDVNELQKLVETMLTAEPNPQRAEEVQRQELAIRFRIGKKRIIAEQMKRVQQRI